MNSLSPSISYWQVVGIGFIQFVCIPIQKRQALSLVILYFCKHFNMTCFNFYGAAQFVYLQTWFGMAPLGRFFFHVKIWWRILYSPLEVVVSIQSSKINMGVICETTQITSPREHQSLGRKEGEHFWLGLLALDPGQTVFLPLCEN